jgi:5'-phosphate synthase pdxT subunit
VTCLSLGPINSLPFFAYFLCLTILSEMVTFWLCMGLVIGMQFPALREFGTSGKPIWGTCAGLIFLADKAVGQKAGGQDLLGGLDCTVHRNFFGCQLNSFETQLPVPALVSEEGGPSSFRAVFIRAPAITEAGPSVEVLAEYTVPSNFQASSLDQVEGQEELQKVIVAVRQKNLMATAFHPELTSDMRW